MTTNHGKYLLIASAVLTIGLVGMGLVGYTRFTQAAATSSCASGTQVTHQVVFKDSHVSPEFTDGKLCDKITITNQDNVTREVAFGAHDKHGSYDGVTEKFLNQNQSFTLSFNKVGMFHFHDHIHDEVMGYFNVTR